MDQKHREYCIRLGNPYMREERFNEQFRSTELENSSWIPESELQNKNTDWLKNKNNNF